MKLPPHQDAIGQFMFDFWQHGQSEELIERDDGFIAAGEPSNYFAPYRDWPAHEKRAIRYARGRVLDIGCGAGRHALYLQERGHDVLGTDVSPLALKVARLRGVRKTRVMPITGVNRRLGVFDTILLLGNNFGLLGGERRARWLLRRFKHMMPEDGRIIASTNDVYQTDAREHTSYHRRNHRRGRLDGQLRIRIRHRQYTTPYFDYLMVSQSEMEKIVAGTGWTITHKFDSPDAPQYSVVLERDAS